MLFSCSDQCSVKCAKYVFYVLLSFLFIKFVLVLVLSLLLCFGTMQPSKHLIVVTTLLASCIRHPAKFDSSCLLRLPLSQPLSRLLGQGLFLLVHVATTPPCPTRRPVRGWPKAFPTSGRSISYLISYFYICICI